MAKLSIITGLRKSNVLDKLESDLGIISAAIKAGDFSKIEPLSPRELAESLNQVLLLSSKASTTDLNKVKRLLRYYVLLIEKYEDKICLSSASVVDRLVLSNMLSRISEKIGVVPRLNTRIELPNAKFLPKDFKKTKIKWGGLPCLNPTRTAKTIETGKIEFFSRDGKASVRAALEAEAGEGELAHVESGPDTFFLNLIDYGFYKLGLLHTDHLLPSASLIQRLKEMIEAMNYNPAFRKEMEDSPYNDGYFIPQGEKVVGSYWLYMAYHNSMQNLWFLLASDNSGGGKVAADPIEWLESREVGRAYIEDLKKSGKSIDKSDVLYTVSDGAALKDSFIGWVKTNRSCVIRICKELSKTHYDMRAEVIAAVSSSAGAGDGRKAVRSGLERGAATHHYRQAFFKEKKDVTKKSVYEYESSEVSSVADDEREAVTAIFSKKIAQDPKVLKLEKELRKRGREIARETKDEVARKRMA